MHCPDFWLDSSTYGKFVDGVDFLDDVCCHGTISEVSHWQDASESLVRGGEMVDELRGKGRSLRRNVSSRLG